MTPRGNIKGVIKIAYIYERTVYPTGVGVTTSLLHSPDVKLILKSASVNDALEEILARYPFRDIRPKPRAAFLLFYPFGTKKQPRFYLKANTP
jgi:hypothetical protein